MTEQELIISRVTLSGVRDNLCNELNKVKQMIDSAKTEKDLEAASKYFEYIMSVYTQQLEDRKILKTR